MLKRRHRGRRLLGIMLLALLFTVAAYAFTAANTVPASNAGDGQACNIRLHGDPSQPAVRTRWR